MHREIKSAETIAICCGVGFFSINKMVKRAESGFTGFKSGKSENYENLDSDKIWILIITRKSNLIIPKIQICNQFL